MTENQQNRRDEDAGKGAVEQDRPGQKTNTSLAGQNPHRDQDPLIKSSDSDFPEPGENEEHTGEPQGQNELNADTTLDPDCLTPTSPNRANSARTAAENQNPGPRQKERKLEQQQG